MDAERERAVSEGVGLLAAGATVTDASLVSGIPRTTLWDTYQRTLGPDSPNAKEERAKADDRIRASSYALAEHSLAQMLSDADAGTLTPGDVRGNALVATKILERLQRWGQTKDADAASFASGLVQALERVGESGQGLVVEVRPAPRDVTPTE